jgi:hypothetical protein
MEHNISSIGKLYGSLPFRLIRKEYLMHGAVTKGAWLMGTGYENTRHGIG